MKAPSLFLLFFVFQGRSCNDNVRTFCTAQRGSIIVEERSSVTIPCNFTYPKKYCSGEVKVSWRRGGTDRCGGGEFIYNHTGGWIHASYTGRISPVENTKEKGTTAITIQDLRKTDGPMFCCRIEIYEGSKCREKWQNRHGTQIQFKDEVFAEQTDVVPAIIGEDIIIPCLVHNNGSSIIEEVTWSMGSSDLCAENNEKTETWKESKSPRGRWSVVNFPQDLSLRIKEVTSEDNKQYCCKVKTKLSSNNVVYPIHGTQVIFADSKDLKLKVEQPETTSPDQYGSATLRCSFTHQSDTDPLWTAIFWRADGPSGNYTYHPLPEMVDPSYRGRTELRGSADLHIKGVTETDNTTYYCFVMLRVCVGNNKTHSTLQYGNGTRLDIHGIVLNNPSTSGKDITWVYVLAALLAVIILFAVFIILLKKKGVICRKRSGREDVKYLTSDIALRARNPSDHEQVPRAISSASMTQEDSGGILYAHLNMASLPQKKSRERKEKTPDNDSQVLYAAVKPTPPPQDIYTTVYN